ncbi:MAG: hypothetical protein M8872_06290 [marine benthic group bacterium]|nr:hypothetical protein [Gemmatimonadota bacterium]
MSSRLIEIPRRSYPQTWWLLDVLGRDVRLLGEEVVDLSAGAIELRHVARELRGWAEPSQRWARATAESPFRALESRHCRRLSFGPELAYLVEHDERGGLHGGRPFRHLKIRGQRASLTPATSAEIGFHFYGRRQAVFAYTDPQTAHGFIGLDWEALSERDLAALLEREMSEPSG